MTLVHTLKREYDVINGDSNVVFQKKEVFKKRWEMLNVFFKFHRCMCWRYQPPL